MAKKKYTKAQAGWGLSRREFLSITAGVAGGAATASIGGIGAGIIIKGSLDDRVRAWEEFSKLTEGLDVLYSFANPSYVREFDQEAAFNRLKESIVVVQAGENGAMSTGVLIGPYVLCTHHGIEDITKPGKELSDYGRGELVHHREDKYPFRFVAEDEMNDLALLHINRHPYDISPAKIEDTITTLNRGREIVVVSTRIDKTIYNTLGKILCTGFFLWDEERVRVEVHKFVADAYVKEGMSGGILADTNGSFLGIVQRKTPELHAIGVGMNVISDFLLRVASMESRRLFQYRKI